jgi:hypothetical protein
VSSDYACRKLYEALDCLVADGPIRDRLRGAALHLVNINSEELPEETQRDFNEVKQQLSMALADSLSHEESIRIARKLLSLYRNMSGAPR